MSEPLRVPPPSLSFDPRLADDLARHDETEAKPASGAYGPRDPFNGYTRLLTPQGGVLIVYQDQDRNLFLRCLRAFAWTVAVGTAGRLVLWTSPLHGSAALAVLALLTLAITVMARRPIRVWHSVEIHPEAMIIDDRAVFRADDIGDHWPELQTIDDDPDRMVLAGICGTRFVEFATVNRVDKNDRTPERLAADLANAMEQLWGRREVTFAD